MIKQNRIEQLSDSAETTPQSGLTTLFLMMGLTVSTLMLMPVGMLFHAQGLDEIMTSPQSRVLPIQ